MPTVRCPLLVGRDAELATVRSALDRARRGRGTALAILGEPGMGKSRLVTEVAAEAAGTMPVLLGRAVGDGPPVPFRPLVEALLGGLRTAGPVDLDSLAAFRPVLGRLLPPLRTAAPPAEPESPMVLAEGVLRLLRALAADRGALIVLEDLHWSDPDTLPVVEYLADNIRDSPLALLVTARDEPRAARAMVERLAVRGSATALTLGPLEEIAVLAMARACLGRDPDAGLAELLRTGAEGVPLVVEELVGAGSRSGHRVPATVAELTRFRLGALPEPARRCVRTAALLGHRFDATLLPAATGQPPTVVDEQLDTALRAQLLTTGSDGGVQFRHALTRDAVVATLLPLERAELAASALASLDATCPNPDGPSRALAAELAATAGNRARAADLLLQTGRADLVRGGLSSAEAALRRSRELAADDPARAVDAAEVLAEVLVQSGQPDQAAEIAADLVQQLNLIDADPSRIATAHLRQARAWTVAGDYAAAAELTARARALAGPDPGPAVRADMVHAQLAFERRDHATAERLAVAVQEATERSGPFELACEALELRGRLARQHDLTAAEVLFERGRRIAADRGLAVWRVRALHELATVEALDGMRIERVEAAREEALRTGSLAVAVDLDLHAAGVRMACGDVDAALEAARRCAETSARLRLPATAVARALQAIGHVLRHEPDDAESLIAAVLATDDPGARAEAMHARALQALLSEDRPAALAAATEAVRHLHSAQVPMPAAGTWVLLATLDGHETALAEASGAPDAGVARWTRGFLGYAAAVRDGRRGRPDAACDAFARAERSMTHPVPLVLFRHLPRRLVAEAALQDEWGEPVRWLTEDLAHFEATGDDRVADACRSLLRAAGAAPPRRSPGTTVPDLLHRIGVTPRELDILRLVASGLTNREIATQLFLSPRTVEKHVERLLARTGAASRRALREWLVQRTPADTALPEDGPASGRA